MPDKESTKDYDMQLLSVIGKIDSLWKNTTWKEQKLRSDLGTLVLLHHKILGPILKMAELTRVEEGGSNDSGFPPLVLRALREALARDETSVSKKELKPNTSPSGWAQDRVVKAALPILQSYLESDEVDAQIARLSQAEPTPQTSSSSKATSEPSPKSQVAELKANKKRKLADPQQPKKRKEGQRRSSTRR